MVADDAASAARPRTASGAALTATRSVAGVLDRDQAAHPVPRRTPGSTKRRVTMPGEWRAHVGVGGGRREFGRHGPGAGHRRVGAREPGLRLVELRLGGRAVGVERRGCGRPAPSPRCASRWPRRARPRPGSRLASRSRASSRTSVWPAATRSPSCTGTAVTDPISLVLRVATRIGSAVPAASKASGIDRVGHGHAARRRAAARSAGAGAASPPQAAKAISVAIRTPDDRNQRCACQFSRTESTIRSAPAACRAAASAAMAWYRASERPSRVWVSSAAAPSSSATVARPPAYFFATMRCASAPCTTADFGDAEAREGHRELRGGGLSARGSPRPRRLRPLARAASARPRAACRAAISDAPAEWSPRRHDADGVAALAAEELVGAVPVEAAEAVEAGDVVGVGAAHVALGRLDAKPRRGHVEPGRRRSRDVEPCDEVADLRGRRERVGEREGGVAGLAEQQREALAGDVGVAAGADELRLDLARLHRGEEGVGAGGEPVGHHRFGLPHVCPARRRRRLEGRDLFAGEDGAEVGARHVDARGLAGPAGCGLAAARGARGGGPSDTRRRR